MKKFKTSVEILIEKIAKVEAESATAKQRGVELQAELNKTLSAQ